MQKMAENAEIHPAAGGLGGLVVLFVSAAEENPTEFQKDPFASLGGGACWAIWSDVFQGAHQSIQYCWALNLTYLFHALLSFLKYMYSL
jgi:hypothetical protein